MISQKPSKMELDTSSSCSSSEDSHEDHSKTIFPEDASKTIIPTGCKKISKNIVKKETKDAQIHNEV